jgi:hypothetical protein
MDVTPAMFVFPVDPQSIQALANIGTLLTGRRFQRGTMPSLALLNPTRSTQ